MANDSKKVRWLVELSWFAFFLFINRFNESYEQTTNGITYKIIVFSPSTQSVFFSISENNVPPALISSRHYCKISISIKMNIRKKHFNTIHSLNYKLEEKCNFPHARLSKCYFYQSTSWRNIFVYGKKNAQPYPFREFHIYLHYINYFSSLN